MRPRTWLRRGGRLATIAAIVAAVALDVAIAVVNPAAALAATAAFCAVGLAWVWIAGSRIWPPDERVASPMLGAAPEAVGAAFAAFDRPIRVGVVGDIQNGISELVDVLRETRRRGCDALLLLGDCANAPRAGRYALLRAILRRDLPGVPVIAVPGNHDLESDGSAVTWTGWVGPTQWRIDVRGWRMLGLDDAAGPISSASMELLRNSARRPPARGVVLVAHRPFHAAASEDPRGVVRARERQFAEAGLWPPPAMTLSGHGHENRSTVDAAGTRHFVQGENCDRSSEGDLATVGGATLILGDDPPSYETWRIPRRVRLRHEIYRAALGTLYPSLRSRGALVFVAVAALLAVAVIAGRAAVER